jgi:uncharacterized membrane protein YfcA
VLASTGALTALIAAFFFTAILYSSAGFGGGSTYSAILVETGLPARSVPLISLPCNIVVSGTGLIRSYRRGLVPTRVLPAILVASVPAAYLGGRVPISRSLFLTLLAVVLLYAGVMSLLSGGRTLWSAEHQGNAWRRRASDEETNRLLLNSDVLVRSRSSMARIVAAGALIGFVSGLVGIGGGIMLSPILQRERGLSSANVSAVSAGFIFFNSVAALTGKVSGLSHEYVVTLLPNVGLLVGVVVVGGVIGSGVSIRGLTPARLSVLTGLLLVSVALRVMA